MADGAHKIKLIKITTQETKQQKLRAVTAMNDKEGDKILYIMWEEKINFSLHHTKEEVWWYEDSVRSINPGV